MEAFYWRILSVIWLFLHLLLQERTLEIRTFWSIFTSGMMVTAKRRGGGGTVTECCVHSSSVVRMDVCSARRASLRFEVTLETAWAAAIWAGRGVSVAE